MQNVMVQASLAKPKNVLERMEIRYFQLPGFVRLDGRVRARRAPCYFELLAHAALLKLGCPGMEWESEAEETRRPWA